MKALTPDSLPAPFGAYEHGVQAGQLIVTSGQLALSPDGRIPFNVREQAERCFENIRVILAEAGADFSNVMRFTGYVTRREDFAPYMAVRDALVHDFAVKPASTLLIVTGFTKPEFLVEVEALAMVPTAR